MINLVKKLILSNSRKEITLFKDQPLILRSLNAFPQDEEINSCIFVLCNNAYKPTPINHVVDIKKFLLSNILNLLSCVLHTYTYGDLECVELTNFRILNIYFDFFQCTKLRQPTEQKQLFENT